MWLVDLYFEVDFISFLVVLAITLELLLLTILIVFINVMHLILTPRLDPILFNERWFTLAELGMYSVWPISLVKSGAYMGLIGFPKRMLKTKRFKDYNLNLTFSKPLVIASQICLCIALSAIFFGLLFLVLVLYVFIETEFL